MTQLKRADVSGRDHYDSLFQSQLANEAEWLDRTAGNKADSIQLLLRRHGVDCSTMLELGCGTGSVIRECQRRGLADRFVAVDYSSAAIEYLRAHSSGIETQVADVTHPSFGLTEAVDVVVLSHVIEHLEQPIPFLESLQKIDFRYLIAEVPLDDLIMGRLSSLGKKDRTQNSAGHVQFFTASSFDRLLRAGGFELMASRRYVQLLDPSTIRFVCRKNKSSHLTYAKMLVGRYLRLAAGPLWSHFFSANYAVLSQRLPVV
jgi:SAM-dependent methyltransferase